MKKSMLILLLMFLMSSCESTENPQKIGGSPSVQTTSSVTTATTAISKLTTVETVVIQPKSTSQTTAVTNLENLTKCQKETTVESPEIQPKSAFQTTVSIGENAEERAFAYSRESVQALAEFSEIQSKSESQTTITVSEIAEEKETAESVTTAVQIEAEIEEIPDIPQKTDYEKVIEVYNFMRENGSGTCVNYACQTYEMCREVGLPCYIVCTNAGMYGHVANTVKIGEIWYILDVQGGYFLDYNYGFTEVVDIYGNHIAKGDILSDYSYDELN